MHVCFCILVVVCALTYISSATKFNIFEVSESIVVYPSLHEEQTTPMNDEGNRRKRAISSTDRTNIINKINSLRISVGASDMNYLSYSSALEDDVANWTSYCDFDGEFYTHSKASHIIKAPSEDQPDPVSVLEESFDEPKLYYLFRSVHLRNVGVSYSYCSTARVKGKYYRDVYMAGYAFSHTSSFDENQKQYTLGKNCTTCLSHSYWCYEGLCRDDCTSQISTCSCYKGCTKCKDWNRGSCTCPSQPITDAVTLDCYNKGETTYKSEASLAMIVLSTVALFYLQ